MIIGNKLIRFGAAPAWWLAGEISSANCVGAWQAIGASSQADSYVNLANPGTYDLTQGAAYPSWSATDGWYTATPNYWPDDYNRYLDTGITIPSGTPTYSAIARFYTNAATGGNYILGSGDSIYAGSNEFGIWAYAWGNAGFLHGSTSAYDPGVDYAGDADGTMAIAGTTPYRNGSALGGSTSGNVTSGSRTVVLWNSRINTGAIERGLTGKLYAAAIYSSTLTGDQVAALHTAIMAL